VQGLVAQLYAVQLRPQLEHAAVVRLVHAGEYFPARLVDHALVGFERRPVDLRDHLREKIVLDLPVRQDLDENKPVDDKLNDPGDKLRRQLRVVFLDVLGKQDAPSRFIVVQVGQERLVRRYPVMLDLLFVEVQGLETAFCDLLFFKNIPQFFKAVCEVGIFPVKYDKVINKAGVSLERAVKKPELLKVGQQGKVYFFSFV